MSFIFQQQIPILFPQLSQDIPEYFISKNLFLFALLCRFSHPAAQHDKLFSLKYWATFSGSCQSFTPILIEYFKVEGDQSTLPGWALADGVRLSLLTPSWSDQIPWLFGLRGWWMSQPNGWKVAMRELDQEWIKHAKFRSCLFSRTALNFNSHKSYPHNSTFHDIFVPQLGPQNKISLY